MIKNKQANKQTKKQKQKRICKCKVICFSLNSPHQPVMYMFRNLKDAENIIDQKLSMEHCQYDNFFP